MLRASWTWHVATPWWPQLQRPLLRRTPTRSCSASWSFRGGRGTCSRRRRSRLNACKLHQSLHSLAESLAFQAMPPVDQVSPAAPHARRRLRRLRRSSHRGLHLLPAGALLHLVLPLVGQRARGPRKRSDRGLHQRQPKRQLRRSRSGRRRRTVLLRRFDAAARRLLPNEDRARRKLRHRPAASPELEQEGLM